MCVFECDSGLKDALPPHATQARLKDSKMCGCKAKSAATKMPASPVQVKVVGAGE